LRKSQSKGSFRKKKGLKRRSAKSTRLPLRRRKMLVAQNGRSNKGRNLRIGSERRPRKKLENKKPLKN
jgi:hypothetical protein